MNIKTIDSGNYEQCLNFLQESCELRKCEVDNGGSLACEKMATVKNPVLPHGALKLKI